MRLHGKTALITGGTSGIGAAAVRLFVAEGAQVAFTGRRQELGQALEAALAEAAQAAGGAVRFLPADHTDLADCERCVTGALAAFERLDILFNNAGVVHMGTAEATSEAAWAETMLLNVTGVWRMSRLVLPHMRAQGSGSIVNNASDWGLVGGRQAVAYCAAKGAVVQMTKAMALDHAREGIRINAVCPGDTLVERWLAEGYWRNAGNVTTADLLAEMGEDLPMGRVGQVDEIARAVLFLASDEASFITGTTLAVDGGNTAG
jgi:meso-butanediol dehydrogenase / (S,S)-butanediol dehydrogenase / diacetyl reductase